MREPAPLPASIVKAICSVQMTMEAVKKSQRNQHGGYQFASTDDIYAALTRRMGEVGLALISLEDECEIVRVEKDGKTSQWARLVYSFILATEEATWSDLRWRRSLYIQVTGPQTFQAAQSYCEKSVLRSVFKIPTGDMDLDSVAQGETEEDQAALNSKRRPKSSSAAKKDGTTDVYNEIIRNVRNAPTMDVLEQIPSLYADDIGTLPQRWHDEYEQEYELRAEKLNPSKLAAE